MKKILILGVTGMLGHVLFYEFSKNKNFLVLGTSRSNNGLNKWFNEKLLGNVLQGIDAENFNDIKNIIIHRRPDIVVNCIGIIKQLPQANDPIISISINSLFPHLLAKACEEIGARLIHISTDCIFNGKRGNYNENNQSDAEDLYGRSKFLGEVNYPNSITLRTSIIGHELKGDYGLIGWFMNQKTRIKGYRNAIFSGFPTVELANIIQNYVIPNDNLSGLYHISSDPISKFDLLTLIARKYNKQILIEPFDTIKENRSLDSALFRNKTGYNPPVWDTLVDEMYQQYISYPCYNEI